MKKGKYAHECREWDGLPIDETCSEIFCCCCFDGEEFKKIKREWNEKLWPLDKAVESV
jgi:hypothetical protein